MRVTKTKKDFPINSINRCRSHQTKRTFQLIQSIMRVTKTKKDFPINSINNESHQNKKRLSN